MASLKSGADGDGSARYGRGSRKSCISSRQFLCFFSLLKRLSLTFGKEKNVAASCLAKERGYFALLQRRDSLLRHGFMCLDLSLLWD